YFSSPSATMNEYLTESAYQQKAALGMRQYLESRSISAYLIDRMMRNSSIERYVLTPANMDKHMGNLAPNLEELTIGRCGLTNSNIFTDGRDFGGVDLPCIRSILIPIKAEYVKSIVGNERYTDALKRL